MKKIFLQIAMLLSVSVGYSQVFTSNTTPVGLEHNMLFNAHTRYQVTQTGSAKVSEAAMFDGRFGPSYTSTAPSITDPTVILIENLPGKHTQTGAWVGWSTRYWQAKRFKIEGYDTYNGNIWKTLADYSNTDYTGGTKFITKINTSGVYKKLRFIFYTAYGADGKLGLSELFYIHPEGMRPYDGLLDNSWLKSGNNISYSNGNVGIGTTSPNSSLEVKGDSGIRVQAKTNGGWIGSIKMADGFDNTAPRDDMLFSTSGGFMFKMDENKNGVSSVSGFNVYDRNNNSVFAIKESSANVGIGTTKPTSKLHVNGNIKTNLLLTNGVDYSSSLSTNMLTFTRGGISYINNNNNDGSIAIRTGGVDNIDLLVNSSGNVGIGTTAPDAKLAVNGNIHTKEVKVDLVGWPDYVFTNDYKLLTLLEVEQHIKKEGHLPNIPSAKEVEKEGGILLGEMNKKLLEKVEELTLYTIQQEKELEKQGKEIEELKSLVKKLINSKK